MWDSCHTEVSQGVVVVFVIADSVGRVDGTNSIRRNEIVRHRPKPLCIMLQRRQNNNTKINSPKDQHHDERPPPLTALHRTESWRL